MRTAALLFTLASTAVACSPAAVSGAFDAGTDVPVAVDVPVVAVDVPTAVVITTKDRTIPARGQRRLAAAIDHAVAFEVAGPHDAIVTQPDQYIPVLERAVAHAGTAPGPPETR